MQICKKSVKGKGKEPQDLAQPWEPSLSQGRPGLQEMVLN